MGAQPVQVGEQFAGAHPSQARAPLVMGAQLSLAGAQYAAGAQPVAQVGAPFAFCAQLTTPTGAQPGELAAIVTRKMPTRCSSLRVVRVSASRPATRSENLFPTSSCIYACASARCNSGGTFLWLRSARRKQRTYGTRTSQISSQTTRSSRAVLKRCLASSNLKDRFARSFAHTRSPALKLSLPTLRAQLTCARRPTPHSRRKQLSLAVDHFIAGLADITTRDYLLHDRACRSLSWQEFVQMAQTCEASRLLLHAPAAAAAITSAKVVAPATAMSACAHDDITAAPAWQSKSARDGRAKRGAHSSRKNDQQARASATRTSHPQENDSPSPAGCSHSSCSNSENSACAPVDQGKSIAKPHAITCFKCCTSVHVASACNSNAKPARQCYACGGIGHIARVCPTSAAQKAANASSLTSGAIVSTCKSAGQLF